MSLSRVEAWGGSEPLLLPSPSEESEGPVGLPAFVNLRHAFSGCVLSLKIFLSPRGISLPGGRGKQATFKGRCPIYQVLEDLREGSLVFIQPALT